MIKISVTSDTSKQKTESDSGKYMYPPPQPAPPAPSNEDKAQERVERINEDDVASHTRFEYIEEEIMPDAPVKPRFKTSEHKSHEG